MRILGLDVGEKTIGIAASDLLGLTAQGIKTIRRVSLKKDLQELGEIISEFDAKILVIGLPKNMNGTEGKTCQNVRDFAEKIQKKFPEIKQIFWDERLSTVAAEKFLINSADLSRKKRKKVIDKMAAVYILQGFLDNQRGKEEIL